MTVTALELDRGTFHGRLPLSGAPAGSYVFELGHQLRITEPLEDGDKIELTQAITADFGVEKLLRPVVILRAPTVETEGATWIFSVLFGATTWYTRRIPADGRELTINSIGIPLTGSPAGTTLMFRLELEIV